MFIAGDYCPCVRIEQLVQKKDFSFFAEMQEYTAQSDYAIVNFECPVVVGNVSPIKKCGPALRTEPNAITSIKSAGFDCVTLANNHFRDYGDEGCFSTINELNKQEVDFVGGGENIQKAQQVLYKEINGCILAIINFCENEFSIATNNRAGAAPLDLIDNSRQIQEAKQKADFVLVIVHGGHEHNQLPSPRMKKTYRYFIEIGADAVVNCHQHCFSGYEYYLGKPIIYGLGNFCFDRLGKCGDIWNEGYCVRVQFEKQQNPKIECLPYLQCDEHPTVSFLSRNAKVVFEQKIEVLNSIIADDAKLIEKFNEWVVKKTPWWLSIFSSYHNRYLNAAASRGYIPRPASKTELAILLNYIGCEAHRDITLAILDKEINK